MLTIGQSPDGSSRATHRHAIHDLETFRAGPQPYLPDLSVPAAQDDGEEPVSLFGGFAVLFRSSQRPDRVALDGLELWKWGRELLDLALDEGVQTAIRRDAQEPDSRPALDSLEPYQH